MTYKALVVADSVSPEGSRILTLSLRYPRFILAEFNTHRMLSRNSASSRAIPVKKLLESADQEPVDPIEWGSSKRGMQAGPPISEEHRAMAQKAWNAARNGAIICADKLAKLGVHKQLVNRILEPFVHTDTVATGTLETWAHFITLRMHKDAQPEIQVLAERIEQALHTSTPRLTPFGDWHTPYVPSSMYPWPEQVKASAARCARVSYRNHDGTACDLGDDQRLADRLKESGHWSPFEHQAHPIAGWTQGNLKGWRQARHVLESKDG